MFSLAIPANGEYPQVSIDVSISGIDISIVDEGASDGWRVLKWTLGDMVVINSQSHWGDNHHFWGLGGDLIFGNQDVNRARLDPIHEVPGNEYTVIELGGRNKEGKHETVECVIDKVVTHEFWDALLLLVRFQLNKLSPG